MNADKLWHDYNKFRLRKTKQFAPSIYKALRSQIDYYIRSKDLINLPQTQMVAALTELYSDVGKNWAFQSYLNVMREAGLKPKPVQTKRRAPIGFNQSFVDDILEFFRLYILNMVQNITQTTRTQIQDIVSKGIELQWSLDEIINELETTGITKMRAARITRTEIGRAADKAEDLGVDRTGLQTRKQWLSVRDGRTRHDHAEVDGQVQPADKPFIVGAAGYLMSGPCAVMSEDGRRVPPSETVNCRCCKGRIVLRDKKTGLPLRKPTPQI